MKKVLKPFGKLATALLLASPAPSKGWTSTSTGSGRGFRKSRRRAKVAPMPAATLPLDNQEVVRQTGNGTPKAKRGWLKKLIGRKPKPLKMSGSTATFEQLDVGVVGTEDFLRQNFELQTPTTLFPTEMLQKDPVVDFALSAPELELFEDVAAPVFVPVDPSEEDAQTEEQELGRSRPLSRVTRAWAQSITMKCLDRWTNGAYESLAVKCEPTGKTTDLARGHFRCDVTVDADKVDFGPLRFSSGRLEAKRLALNLWSFTPNKIPVNAPRFPNQFDFLAHDIVLTQNDLFESRCIRNGLRRLLTRILTNRGLDPTAVSIKSIEILPSGKIACQGEATTILSGRVPFEVRSGISTNSRGHVVTFPGLEVSLNPALGIFVPVLPEISLDLGHNAQIVGVNLDGKRAEMRLSARATITPDHTLQLTDYTQSSQSFAASFSVDVGRWLTGLGNFTY